MKTSVTEDKLIWKTVLKEGYGGMPESIHEVSIHYIMRLSNGVEIDSTFSRGSLLKFLPESDQVISGLSLAVKTMKKGEKALFDIDSKYAYGDSGNAPKIPPGSSLQIEVELVDFSTKKKPLMDMTSEEKKKAGEEFKVQGNEKFKVKLYKDAATNYKDGINYLDSILDYDHREEILPLWTSLQLNLCVCLNSLGLWGESKQHADKVIARNVNNAKARYLRGVAEKNLGQCDEAIADLTFALEANPTDERIKFEIEAAREKKKATQNKEKKVFEKMFQKESLYAEKIPKVEKVPPYDPTNPLVYLDIQIGKNETLNRIVIELFSKHVPKAAENFKCLCTGEKSTGGQKLYYKGCKFHKLVKGFMIEGGDFENGDGTGGASIYGKTFADEPIWFEHESRGLLTMSNNGPNTNGSRFFISFNGAPWISKKNVTFGRVVKGYDTLKLIEDIPVGEKDAPKEDIRIADCGEYKEKIDIPEKP